MKKFTACVLLYLFLFATPFVSNAQNKEPSLNIAGINLQLGMSKNDIIKDLSKNYDLKKFSEADSYVIFPKTRDKNGELVDIGLVSFRENKLTYAAKRWYAATGKESAYDMAEVLHTVLEKVNEEVGHVARVKTNVQKEPTITSYTMEFDYLEKLVRVSITDFKDFNKSVRIDEVIKSQPASK